jgi:hypothetical protein
MLKSAKIRLEITDEERWFEGCGYENRVFSMHCLHDVSGGCRHAIYTRGKQFHAEVRQTSYYDLKM